MKGLVLFSDLSSSQKYQSGQQELQVLNTSNQAIPFLVFMCVTKVTTLQAGTFLVTCLCGGLVWRLVFWLNEMIVVLNNWISLPHICWHWVGCKASPGPWAGGVCVRVHPRLPSTQGCSFPEESVLANASSNLQAWSSCSHFMTELPIPHPHTHFPTVTLRGEKGSACLVLATDGTGAGVLVEGHQPNLKNLFQHAALCCWCCCGHPQHKQLPSNLAHH